MSSEPFTRDLSSSEGEEDLTRKDLKALLDFARASWRKLNVIHERLEKLMSIYDDLVAKVTSAATQLDAATAVINTHTAFLVTLRAQLAASQQVASPETVQNAINTLDTHLAGLATATAAMNATDPAAPAAQAEPAATTQAAPAAPAAPAADPATQANPTPPATPPAQ